MRFKRKLQDITVIVVAVVSILAVFISYYTFFNNVEEGSNDIDELSGINKPSVKNINEYVYTKASNGLPNSGDYNYLDLGDVDNDNDLDIVAGTGGWPASIFGLHLYLNDGKGSWTNSDSGLPATGTYGCVKLIDINSDGNLDILASHERYARSNGRGIVIFLGDGKGGWKAGSSPSTQNYIAEF
ncbi:MAG: VCBS repeat-containing protein, partial [Thermoplasmata archaeon]|nr:VCBS repeat-containing protein [Thermoplasmata archaeon]